MVAPEPSGRRSPEEFVEQLRVLVADNIAGNAELLTRLSALIQEAVKSAASPSREPPSGGALLSRWLDFNLASYSVVSTHGLAIMSGLLSAAEAALLPRPSPRPGTSSRVELRLEGRPGERVTSAFMVENHFDHPLEVSLECGDLVPAAGPALPASLLSFEPTPLSIGPRAQAVVQIAATLGREFVVGQTYVTVVRLGGLTAKEIGLSITVRPPAPAAPVAASGEAPR
ncbi:MAG TPA: hypothetical protein VF653_08680 [Methylomirabilota bacterium]